MKSKPQTVSKMLNHSSYLVMKEHITKALWVLAKDFRQLAILTVLMYMLRLFLERYVFSIFGILIGVRDKPSKKRAAEHLKNNARNFVEITEKRHSTSMKFCSCAWRFLYYTSIFSYGLYILWNKPWLWDINKCWLKFGKQKRTTDLKAYYFITLSYYCSMLIRDLKDRKTGSHWQTLVHHVATILLLAISWTTGTFRVGSLIILLHDCADIFLESAKMCKYSGRDKHTVVLFLIFSVIWMITRLGLLPFWIIKNTAIDSLKIVRVPAYNLVNGLLLVLQFLHLNWTYYIFKVFHKLFTTRVITDSRSDTEASDAESNEAHQKRN